MASRIASEIWSQILSGWPSVTDSDVNNRRFVKKSSSLYPARLLSKLIRYSFSHVKSVSIYGIELPAFSACTRGLRAFHKKIPSLIYSNEERNNHHKHLSLLSSKAFALLQVGHHRCNCSRLPGFIGPAPSTSSE